MSATCAPWARLSVVALLAAGPGWAADPVKQTYTFKTVGDLKVQADVYRPDDTKVRPVVVWIHGGALIMGNRTSVPRNLLDLCRDEGYALVSIDYRLAPEVKLPEIIADVRGRLPLAPRRRRQGRAGSTRTGSSSPAARPAAT